jgi:hypothetical protein
MKTYRVTLTAEERQQLQAMIAVGRAAAEASARARILLKADGADGGPAWPDHEIAGALEVGVDTAERVRRRLVEDGLDAAPRREPQGRPSREPVLDGGAEARPVALACSARRTAASPGPCGSRPTASSSWRWSSPSRRRRCARRRKRRPQAVAPPPVGDPAGGRRRLRGGDGGCP